MVHTQQQIVVSVHTSFTIVKRNAKSFIGGMVGVMIGLFLITTMLLFANPNSDNGLSPGTSPWVPFLQGPCRWFNVFGVFPPDVAPPNALKTICNIPQEFPNSSALESALEQYRSTTNGLGFIRSNETTPSQSKAVAVYHRNLNENQIAAAASAAMFILNPNPPNVFYSVGVGSSVVRSSRWSPVKAGNTIYIAIMFPFGLSLRNMARFPWGVSPFVKIVSATLVDAAGTAPVALFIGGFAAMFDGFNPQAVLLFTVCLARGAMNGPMWQLAPKVVIFDLLLMFVASPMTELPLPVVILAAVLSPTCVFMFALLQLRFDANVLAPLTPTACLILQLVQLFAYPTLAVYLSNVVPYPGRETKRKPLLYFLSSQPEVATSEKEPAVHLEGLTKYYGKQRDTAALDDVSLSVNSGEILAILGHNGAGKTTLLSIISGDVQPTSDPTTATIRGRSLLNDLDNIRAKEVVVVTQQGCDSIGLMGALTARQQLVYAATMYGVEEPSLASAQIMARLNIQDNDEQLSTLSAGKSQVISTACAIISGAPIMLLDEPTAAVDPASRQLVWNALDEERRRGRTIILTTHLMEEAEYLADRVLIMSHGKKFCCMKTMDLKQEYGVGYHLTVVKQAPEDVASPPRESDGPAASTASNAFSQASLDTILSRYELQPDAARIRDTLVDTTYIIPQQCSAIGDLLTELEAQLESIGATSYALIMNSLEDVFLEIVKMEAEDKDDGAPAIPTHLTLPGGTAEKIEDRFLEARDNSQTWGHFMFTVTMLMKLRWRHLVACLVVGFILTMPSFATVLRSENDKAAEGSQQEVVNSGVYPDMNNLRIVVTRPPSSSNGTVNSMDDKTVEAILASWSSYYTKMRQLQGHTSKLTTTLVTSDQFKAGDFDPVPTRSMLSFTGRRSFPPAHLVLNTYDKLANHSKISYGWAFSRKHYTPGFLVQLDVALKTAINAVVSDEQQPIPDITTPRFKTAPAAPKHSDTSKSTETKTEEEIEKPEFIITAVLVALAVGGCWALACVGCLDTNKLHYLCVQGVGAKANFTAILCHTLISGIGIGVTCIISAYTFNIKEAHDAANLLFIFLFVIFASFLPVLFHMLCFMGASPQLKRHVFILVEVAVLCIPTIAMMILYFSVPLWITALVPYAQFAVVFRFEDNLSLWQDVPAILGLASMVVYDAVLGLLVLRSLRKGLPTPPVASATREMELAASPGTTDDVGAEASAVERAPHSFAVASSHLSKVFTVGGTPNAQGEVGVCEALCSAKNMKIAVDDLSFGVHHGECFGLLGPNGAGKSTVVKMLLSHIEATKGHVHYEGVPEGVSLDEFCCTSRLGWCPQDNEQLFTNLTPAQNLHAALRFRLGPMYGSDDLWADYVSAAIKTLKLDEKEAQNKVVSELSGGMQRRLATAVALYSGSRIALLDEPSSGVDPYLRRKQWKAINDFMAASADNKARRSVILTTHSMEEADAVCTRIGIMTKGSLRCLGTSQHLKDRFSGGYLLVANLTPLVPMQEAQQQPQVSIVYDEHGVAKPAPSDPRVSEVEKQVLTAFNSAATTCTLVESRGQQLQFNLDRLPSIAVAFKTLEANATAWSLASYTITQITSLQHIFVAVAGASAVDEASPTDPNEVVQGLPV